MLVVGFSKGVIIDPPLILYGSASEKFSHKPLLCAKEIQEHTVEDAFGFHRRHHHSHKKFWQQLSPLHGIDNRSDGARGVGKATPAMCWSSVVRPHPVGMTVSPYWDRTSNCMHGMIQTTLPQHFGWIDSCVFSTDILCFGFQWPSSSNQSWHYLQVVIWKQFWIFKILFILIHEWHWVKVVT